MSWDHRRAAAWPESFFFNPSLTFKLKRDVVRNGRPTVAVLNAHITVEHIVWLITEEVRIDREVVMRDVASKSLKTKFGDLECDEVQRRIGHLPLHEIVSMAKQNACTGSADTIWFVFHSAYYPGEVEDEHNAWVMEGFPELHNEVISLLKRRNDQIVREVLGP